MYQYPQVRAFIVVKAALEKSMSEKDAIIAVLKASEKMDGDKLERKYLENFALQQVCLFNLV